MNKYSKFCRCRCVNHPEVVLDKDTYNGQGYCLECDNFNLSDEIKLCALCSAIYETSVKFHNRPDFQLRIEINKTRTEYIKGLKNNSVVWHESIYLRASRTVQHLLVYNSDKTKLDILYLYNYEGTHYRVLDFNNFVLFMSDSVYYTDLFNSDIEGEVEDWLNYKYEVKNNVK